jgi:uncharacterized membrane protein YeiB
MLIILVNVYILLVAAILLADGSRLDSRILAPVERTGRIAFTAYYLNAVVIFGIAEIISTILPSARLPIEQQLLQFAVLAAFVWALSVIERRWAVHDYIMGPEWLLRKGAMAMTKVTERCLFK